MATIKSYTDLEQSKKLAEILSLESADMYWRSLNLNGHISWSSHIKRLEPPIYDLEHYIPCWSLAALLSVLPDELKDNHFFTLQKEKNECCCCYEDINGNSFRHTFASNPVDACYEMIIKLNELKLL